MILATLVALLLLAGALFITVAAVGLLRLPDLLTRMHSATKAGSLGVGFILTAAALHSGDVAAATRAILVLLLVFLTAPVAAHMIARAAHIAGSGHAAGDVAGWPGGQRQPRAAPPAGEGPAGANGGSGGT